MTNALEDTAMSLDTDRIRADFPILKQMAHGHPLVYLDNGATTHKPQAVIDTMRKVYEEDYGTVRRGVYALSVKATQAYDAVREKVAQFLNAPSVSEIVFTRGTTEAINLVAHSYGRVFIGQGDDILISAMEHHANIVPWQQLCKATGAVLKVIPMNDAGELDMEAYTALLSDNTKLVAVNHVSNALGTVNPVKDMARLAHAHNAVILVDGAQSAPHMTVDVQDLDCDFYAFSGHKIYGPTGVGVLYGKYGLLEKMEPYQTGGDMIDSVTFEKTTFGPPPRRFEAGTPAIAQVIGLGAALDYVSQLGLEAIHAYENELLAYATAQLAHIDGLRIIGTAKDKAAVISFVLEGIHPHDIGTVLDQHGVAVRAGHHCAQPVMERFGLAATTRVSFAFYNTTDDVDRLVTALHAVKQVFA